MPAAPILILVAHPELRHSRVNRRLMHAARALADASHGDVSPANVSPHIVVHDLYAAYPDFDINVPHEQSLLQAADLVVWQHPVYWYSMPALMKLWVDSVLERGWAYGGGEALRGKYLWPVLSTGGPQEAYAPEGYNRHAFDAFLPPYSQTAALCHMRFVRPLVLHGAHAATPSALDEHAALFGQRLSNFPSWLEQANCSDAPDCSAPASDRPAL